MTADPRRLVVCTLLVAAVAISVGCAAAGLIPRTYTTSVSPDGRHTASVRRGPTLDPPDDSLLLATDDGRPQVLMSLAPDADWCRTVVWTPDSRKVGFVIADDRLAVFDVATRTLEAFFFMAGSGCCGGPQESRNVTFTADGTLVSFDRFDRPMVRLRSSDGTEFEAAVSRESLAAVGKPEWPLVRAARNLGREFLRVPTRRLRLQLVSDAGAIPPAVFVKVVLPDRRWIEVEARPAPDGLVVLPAIADGPVDRLEIGAVGLGGRRIHVDDVRTRDDVTTVVIPRGRAD